MSYAQLRVLKRKPPSNTTVFVCEKLSIKVLTSGDHIKNARHALDTYAVGALAQQGPVVLFRHGSVGGYTDDPFVGILVLG